MTVIRSVRRSRRLCIHCAVAMILLVSAALLPATAQQGPNAGPSDPMPAHCRYAPAISFASLPPAVPLPGIGTSTLAVTTTSKRAQQFFDQGLNLLHCFWDTEAYRAFREAARADDRCAMAWWGIFTALGQNPQEMAAERSEALKRAVELSSNASDREQYYIRAAALLVEPGKGRPAWIAEMEALIDRYPDDVEAKLLLANALSTPAGSYLPNGRPREGKLYGQAILKNLLVTHPNHAAVNHYWIHAVENGPRPEDALESAERLPRLAPGSGHMLHMPGHIYYRLGRYADARRAFLASMEQDLAYMREQSINPINNWNYVHNLDYLVGTCAEDGRFAEGMKWSEVLLSVPVAGDRMRATGSGYILYGGYTSLVRLQMRYGRWADASKSLAAALEQTSGTGSMSERYLRGLEHYVDGMAALESDRLGEAADRAKALTALVDELKGAKAELAADWYFGYAQRILTVHETELRGVILSHQGAHDAAIETLKQAVDLERNLGYWEPPHYARPVAESLARACLRAGRSPQAREAWELALRVRPENGHALFGLARTAELAGDTAAVRRAYERFLTAWRNADADLPQVVSARAWLREHPASPSGA